MSILVIRFCNVFSVKRLLWRSTGTLNCRFIFVSDHFLQQISIFQSSFWFIKTLFYKFGFRNSGYFISNLSVFIRDIKLDLFYSFSAIPHHYGSYLKIQAQVCPICQNLINPKQSGYVFMATFRLVRSGVLGGLMI